MTSIPVALFAALLLAAPAAFADPVPSSDAMLDSLDLSKRCPPGGCRGIHAIGPSETTRRPATSEAADAGSGVLDLSVEFASGSATLAPAATHVLAHLGKALTNKRLAADRFRIEGHTDTVGDPATNQTLSEQRAASVAEFLEKNFGIDSGRLQTVGLGKKDLAVETADQTPEPRNRRVHIANLGS